MIHIYKIFISAMDNTLYISETQPVEVDKNVFYTKPHNFYWDNELHWWQDLVIEWIIKDVIINHEWSVYEWYYKNYSILLKMVIEEVLSSLDDDGSLTVIIDSVKTKHELLELFNFHDEYIFKIQDKATLQQDYDYNIVSQWNQKKYFEKKLSMPTIIISDIQVNQVKDFDFNDYLEKI